MLNGINLENSDISKLLKGTKKNIKDANGSYHKDEDESFAVLDTNSEATSEVSTYNKKGVVTKKDFQLKDSTILPNRYNTKLLAGGIYYKGEKISQMELLEKAVESGSIELDEDASIWENYNNAWKSMIEANAKPLYDWSTSLYSEDGMYKFRVEDGEITGLMSTKNSSGVSLQEMAIELANGKSPADIPDVSWLSWNDRELYDAALNIGDAKNLFYDATEEYTSHNISYKEYMDELEPLFFIMFGDYEDQTTRFLKLNEIYSKDDFGVNELKNYNPIKYSIVFDEE